MNHLRIIEHLRVNQNVFKYLFQSVSDEQARWKPGADKWSMLEVINHLYDEEREDFRKRLELVLKNPGAGQEFNSCEGRSGIGSLATKNLKLLRTKIHSY
jgi:uncharacterized damage-inducible protein DinB